MIHRAQALRLALAILVLGALFLQLNMKELTTTLARADCAALAASVLLNVPVLGLVVLRSRLVLDRLGYRIAWRIQAPITIVSFIAPIGVAEVVRIVEMRRGARVTASDAVALAIYERGISFVLLAVGTMIVGALILLPAVAAAVIAAAMALATLTAVLSTKRKLFLPQIMPALLSELLGRANTAAATVGTLRCLVLDLTLLIRWSALTAGVFALISIQVWLLARSIEAEVSIPAAWVAFGGSQVAAVISLLPLGLGVADASMAYFLSRLGVDIIAGAGIVALLRLTATLPLVIIAFVTYLTLSPSTSVSVSQS